MICPHCGCGSAEPVASAQQRGEAQAAWLKKSADLRPEQRKADQQAEAQRQAASDLDYALPESAVDEQRVAFENGLDRVRRTVELAEEKEGAAQRVSIAVDQYVEAATFVLTSKANERVRLEALLDAQRSYDAAKAAAQAWARKTGHLL